jgi:hypothetical protein
VLARVVRKLGGRADQAWPLPIHKPLVIGRQPDADINLSPDPLVSRSHARIWRDANQWWIEDTGSSNGTRVRGRKIRGLGPVELSTGDEILVGNTLLELVVSSQPTVRAGPLLIEVQVAPAVNFSLVHCGAPVVETVTVQACYGASGSARLMLDLKPYAQARELVVPPLAEGATTTISRPQFALEYGVLQAQTERTRWPLKVRVDGVLARGDPIECWVLGHNEWSAAETHRESLAAFVLPNHPLVDQLVSELDLGDGDPSHVLEAIHNHLSTHWQLSYRLEPPNWTSPGQKVRWPHQVLLDPERRVGLGTCLDLALLYAACLENVGLQPVLAILDMGRWWHALVGVWRVQASGLEPVVLDRQRLLDEVEWIDATACTVAPELRRDTHAARQEATRILSEQPLQFALDVAAARNDGITPLPFAGEPLPSPAVVRAVEAATRASGGHAGANLLLGLLGIEGGLTRHIMAARVGSLDATVRRINASLQPDAALSDGGVRTARNLAATLARDEGSPMILERHLLSAVLLTASASLDAALAGLGIGREQLLSQVRTSTKAGGTQYSLLTEWKTATLQM